MVSVGRKPNTNGLGLEKLNLKIDKHGFIETNENFQTSISNIYAIGDVIKGPMLAHKAEEDGVAAVEIINGEAVTLITILYQVSYILHLKWLLLAKQKKN